MVGVPEPHKSPVHELELILGSKARQLVERESPLLHQQGERESPLLHQHADVTELLHMVEAWQAPHHLLGTKPLQGLEVKVPEALVPLPHLVIPTSS